MNSDSMQKLKHILVITILLISCQSIKETKTTTEEAKIILELKRGACYGTCPIYTFTLDTNKKVNYHAKRFTEPLGLFEWHLSRREYNQIVNLMEEEISHGNIENNLNALDLPLMSLKYYSAGDTLQVKCKGSCPEGMKNKIRKIETILFRNASWNFPE
jgi:hypothetical protein